MARNNRRKGGFKPGEEMEKLEAPEPTVRQRGGQRGPQLTKFPPRSRGGPSRPTGEPSRGSGILRRSTDVVLRPPERYVMEGLAGRTVETSPYAEPIFNITGRVWQIALQGGCNYYGYNQTGSSQQLQVFVDNLFPLLQQKILQKGRFISGTLGTAANFFNWLTGYSNAFILARTLESILSCNGINVPFTRICAAGSQFKVRLETALQRIASFPVPQGLVDMLDRMAGVAMYTEATNAYFAILDTTTMANAYSDLTSATSWSNLLADLEAMLSQPFNGISVQDNQLILNVLGDLYGIPVIGPKGYSKEGAIVDQWKNMAMTWDDTGASPGALTVPAVNSSTIEGGNIVPLLVERGRPVAKWEMSLYRPQVYQFTTSPLPYNKTTSTNFLAGFLFTTGVVIATNGPMHLVSYEADNGGATVNVFGQASVPTGLTLGWFTFTYAANASSEVALGPISNGTLAGGQTDLYHIYDVSQDIMVDESILQLTQIFELSN